MSRSLTLPGILLSVLTTVACGRAPSAAAAKPSRPPLAVRVAPVVSQELVYRIKALGSLEAEEMVQVTAEVEGAVTEVRFHEGDRVTPSTVLLRIDPERFRLEAQQAEASLNQSLAERGRAEADLKRREELNQNQLVAAEELNRSRGETSRLLAGAEAARATRDIAAQNLRKSDVRPPHAGAINTKTVETGQYVKTGTVLATLVDTSRLRLRFKISESESLRAHVGDAVTFRVAPLGPQDFPAVIYHVGEVADPQTRQVQVLAWVKNPGQLKPGFFAEVTIAGESKKEALVVPEGAVQASEQGFVTYVVDKGKARVRPIEIGLRTGTGVVEILSGVKAGETVVVEGSDRLADGVDVQAVTGAGGAATAAQ